ncbi:hypothetical protein HGA64_03375 [Candidatus Falkowbacteria bacterium]|nr:hypothetical protein [Candidatus Falkowbacteria bacterium]
MGNEIHANGVVMVISLSVFAVVAVLCVTYVRARFFGGNKTVQEPQQLPKKLEGVLGTINNAVEWSKVARTGTFSIFFEFNLSFIDGKIKAIKYVNGGYPFDALDRHTVPVCHIGPYLTPRGITMEEGMALLIEPEELMVTGAQEFLVCIAGTIKDGKIIPNSFHGKKGGYPLAVS